MTVGACAVRAVPVTVGDRSVTAWKPTSSHLTIS